MNAASIPLKVIKVLAVIRDENAVYMFDRESVNDKALTMGYQDVFKWLDSASNEQYGIAIKFMQAYQKCLPISTIH